MYTSLSQYLLMCFVRWISMHPHCSRMAQINPPSTHLTTTSILLFTALTFIMYRFFVWELTSCALQNTGEAALGLPDACGHRRRCWPRLHQGGQGWVFFVFLAGVGEDRGCFLMALPRCRRKPPVSSGGLYGRLASSRFFSRKYRIEPGGQAVSRRFCCVFRPGSSRCLCCAGAGYSADWSPVKE